MYRPSLTGLSLGGNWTADPSFFFEPQSIGSKRNIPTPHAQTGTHPGWLHLSEPAG